MTKSTSHKELSDKSLDLSSNEIFRFDTILISSKLKGSAVNDEIKLQVDDFDREVKMKITFEQIYDSTSTFEDFYDGFVGISPW